MSCQLIKDLLYVFKVCMSHNIIWRPCIWLGQSTKSSQNIYAERIVNYPSQCGTIVRAQCYKPLQLCSEMHWKMFKDGMLVDNAFPQSLIVIQYI